jgi:hypothetical protein
VYLIIFISHLEGKWYRLFQSDEILMFKLFFIIVVRFCYYTFMKLCIISTFHLVCIFLGANVILIICFALFFFFWQVSDSKEI